LHWFRLILAWLSPLYRLTVGVVDFIVSIDFVEVVDFIGFNRLFLVWLIPLLRLSVGVDDFIC
jgi:hypothetical protein